MERTKMTSRFCLCDPIPELAIASKLLDEAVTAHLAGEHSTAADLFQKADIPAITGWTESLWGADSPYVRRAARAPGAEAPTGGTGPRMPDARQKRALLERDGFVCRFCGISLVRSETRKRIQEAYPGALRWGARNSEQHAAFQAMTVNYDHVLPWTRGGLTEPGNLVITCAPCNYGRMELTLEEVGLADPRTRPVAHSSWDGLERFR